MLFRDAIDPAATYAADADAITYGKEH